MPIINQVGYVLPSIAISGSNVGQELTSNWQNTTFTDIYNVINNDSLANNITSTDTLFPSQRFNANLQIIRTSSTASRTGDNLKLVSDLPAENLPPGALMYHDKRYGVSKRQLFKYKDLTAPLENLEFVCCQVHRWVNISER